jgi:uncharacterized membrane protein YkvA (DUF1232 family)
MGLFKKLRSAAGELKQQIRLYQLVLKDKRTPRGAKVLLWLALGYLALPFDLIPDWIPVIGHLDDLIIVPLLIICAKKMIPEEIIQDCKNRLTRDA